MANTDAIKPHAIMVEFLYQGHITPFVHLAIALASKGCTVTYVQTEYIQHLMTISNPHKQPDFLFSGAREAGLDIRFTTISDGFPLDFDRSLNFVEFYESILRDFPARVDELVGKIVTEGGIDLRPFLVADTSYLWPPAVAAKHGIPNVSFWTSTAQHLSIGYHLELLKENGLILKSYGEYSDDLHNDLPFVKASSVRDHMKCALTEDEFLPQVLKDSVMKACLQVKKADFVLCNTVEELEGETISGLTYHFPTYAIGPTNFSTKISTPESLRPATDCTEWLNSKPPRSVLFVSFGSLAPGDKEVISEMARGLCVSGAYFLWVARPDQEQVVVPPTDRGLVVPWCNQREVLANPAVGGFLTHCGWNSLLESMWFGVPLICYPIFMDQPVNRNLIVDDWKIGINLCDKEPLTKQEVGEKINKLMSCSSDELRSQMGKVSKIVQGALGINGSSNRNIDQFLQDLKNKISS